MSWTGPRDVQCGGAVSAIFVLAQCGIRPAALFAISSLLGISCVLRSVCRVLGQRLPRPFSGSRVCFMSVDEVFFDRVAHDLRGELSTMLAGVHYLLRFGRDLAPPTLEMLERVSGAGERLTRMLAEFDDAVWLLDTQKPLVLAPICLGELIDEVMSRVEPTVKTRGIRLVLELTDADAASTIVGDVDLLATALTSVVDLATLRASAGTVHVTVEIRDGAPILRVRDEGEAVPKDVLARLFEPFVEREIVPRETHGRRKLRLGIGLPIARAILEAHGGSLVVEPSESGLTLRGVVSLRKASEIPPEPEKARAG